MIIMPSILTAGLACGSSSDGDREPAPASNGAAGTASMTGSPASDEPNAQGMPSAEDIAALTEVFGMAADQIQSTCGTTFDTCGATPGCNEILTCAASNACSGRDCYCLGEGCSMPGPCRAVIDAAPGARVPDTGDPSLGPASDAARDVGACLQGLGGGALPPPATSPQPSAPGGDAGALDAG